MTTVRVIMTRSARIVQEANEGTPAPNAWFASEVALGAFNDMMRDMRGQEIGQNLKRKWDATAGDTAIAGGLYKVNIYTPDEPKNGDRFGVIGARTVTATEDTIETAASVVTTASTTWFYREDSADWIKEADLTLDSQSLLSSECDEALAAMLAARCHLETFGQVPQGLSNFALSGRGRIRRLYKPRRVVAAENAVLRGLANRVNWPTS